MWQFFETLFAGIKQGTIAAWYDMKWYLCIMGCVLLVYLVYSTIKKYLQK